MHHRVRACIAYNVFEYVFTLTNTYKLVFGLAVVDIESAMYSVQSAHTHTHTSTQFVCMEKARLRAKIIVVIVRRRRVLIVNML